MQKLEWLRVNNSLTLVIGPAHHTLNFDSEEEAKEVEGIAAEAKEGDRDAYNELMVLLDPASAAEEMGYIKKIGRKYYLSDTGIPVDDVLARTIIEFQNNGYPMEGLLNFAKMMYLNPLDHVHKRLYEFVRENGIVVTSKGYMVLYKAVATRDNVPSTLREFVAESVSKVARWKKSPSNYDVYEDNEEDSYHLVDTRKNVKNPTGFYVGDLKALYDNMSELDHNPDYTDKYSRSMDITLGKPVRIPWEKCDTDPSHACSNGLHAGSFEYINWFGNHGDRVLAVLVNPMNVSAVPESSKLRACEYLPISILDKDGQGVYQEIEGSYWEDDYISEEIQQLQEDYSEYDFVYEGHDSVASSNEDEKKATVISERINYLRG